jgi:anti-anti-sigma regulatory factor
VQLDVVSLRTCVITLSGDHGVSMRERLAEEMLRTTGIPHLIVDLTPCTFIDATMFATLVRGRPAVSRPAELVVPDDGGHASRTVKRSLIDRFLLVHASLEEALRSEPRIPWSAPTRCFYLVK